MPGYGIGMTSSAMGVGDLAERLDGGLPGLGVAVEDEHDRERGLAVELGRDERRGRSGHQDRDRREGLRRAGRDRAEAAQDLAGRRHEQRAAEDHPDRIEAELEAGHDAEVAAAAADGPEQVGVLLLARGDEPALGGDDLDRDERIDGQAVLAHQPADAATERQAGQADAAGVAERASRGRGRRPPPCTRPRSGPPGPTRDAAPGRCAGPSCRSGRGRCRPRSCRSRPGCASRHGSRARGRRRGRTRRSAPRRRRWPP